MPNSASMWSVRYSSNNSYCRIIKILDRVNWGKWDTGVSGTVEGNMSVYIIFRPHYWRKHFHSKHIHL